MAAPLPTAKQQLLKDACNALHKATHSVRARATRAGSNDSDGTVELTFANGNRAAFDTSVHTTLSASALVEKPDGRKAQRKLDVRRLHVTSWVSPKVAAALIAKRIPFMDTAGNAFIEKDGNTVLVVGNPKPIGTVKRYASKSVTPKGIAVAFALLTKPDAVALPLRQIAALSGAALSTANEVIDDLLKAGIVGVDKQGKRFFLDKRRAMREWMSNYSARLRPRLDSIRLRSDDDSWWRTTDFKSIGALLGGEPAAEVLTGTLKAHDITIYCQRSKLAALVKAGKLALAPQGNIEVVEPFWLAEINNEAAWSEQSTVHPLIVCADLTHTGDSRNLEAAQDVYDQYLANS